LIETINIGQKLGYRFPSTPKPFAIAIDEQQGRAYVSSQTSALFPILDLDSTRQLGFVNAPFTPSGDELALLANSAQKLLYIYPANPQRDSVKTLYALNTASNQIVTTASYQYGITHLALERASNRLFLADNSVLRILNGTTLQQEDSIAFPYTIGGIALDSARKRFFITSRDIKNNQMQLGVYALAKPYSLQKAMVLATPVALPKMFIDSNWNRLLLVGLTNARVLQLGTSVVVKHITFGGTYPHAVYSPSTERLLLMNDGYSGQGEGGNYGKLLAIGSVKDTRDSVRLGLRCTGIALDETRGIIATVAEQQASVQFLQTSTLKPFPEKSAIDIGRSFDDMTVSPDGTTVYLSNHFGSRSRLVSYAFSAQELTEFATGAWTTALLVDSARGRLFALAQQENTIYLYSTLTNSFLGKIPIFGYKELRSDALASLAMDKARQKLYVCMPEHKSIASIDLSSSATDKSYKILGYSFTPYEASNGGVQIAFAPEANKLYVLRAAQKSLNIYNLHTNVLIDSIGLGTRWTVPMQLWNDKILVYDPFSRQAFVGGVGIDLEKNRVDTRVLAGASRFLGYNAKHTALFAIAKSEGTVILQEHHPQTFALLASRVLYTSAEERSPLAYFDSKRNQLLLMERESGILRRYDVNTLTSAPVAKADTALTTLSIFPNPVVSQATVRFGVRTKEKVKLTIFDSQGREVTVLTEGEYEAGTHTLTLKVESDAYSTQTYFVQLKSPSMFYSKPIQVQRH
jgi:DNA-binding beta-propeller fold protein YncE